MPIRKARARKKKNCVCISSSFLKRSDILAKPTRVLRVTFSRDVNIQRYLKKHLLALRESWFFFSLFLFEKYRKNSRALKTKIRRLVKVGFRAPCKHSRRIGGSVSRGDMSFVTTWRKCVRGDDNINIPEFRGWHIAHYTGADRKTVTTAGDGGKFSSRRVALQLFTSDPFTPVVENVFEYRKLK